jgi:hypothetical protein
VRLVLGIMASVALIAIAAAVLLAAVGAVRYRRGGPWDQQEMAALDSGAECYDRWMRQHMPEFMGDPPRWWETDEFELGYEEYHAKYGRRADCGMCGPAGCEGLR